MSQRHGSSASLRVHLPPNSASSPLSSPVPYPPPFPLALPAICCTATLFLHPLHCPQEMQHSSLGKEGVWVQVKAGGRMVVVVVGGGSVGVGALTLRPSSVSLFSLSMVLVPAKPHRTVDELSHHTHCAVCAVLAVCMCVCDVLLLQLLLLLRLYLHPTRPHTAIQRSWRGR